ncbi:MAG: SDR family oxidoreductase [Acidobacteria bacterium]|nr:SDR family oxidoreductase [Acidobacteriota bacterium]
MAKILVAGASGKVGQSTIKELKKQGHTVRAVLRDRTKLGALADAVEEIIIADACEPHTLRGVCANIDVVISTIGGSLQLGRTKGKAGYWEVDFQANKNLLAEAQAAQVRKFIYVSVFQAEQMKGIVYGEAHAAFEEELKQSGLDYSLIRPTGIFYIFEEFVKLARKGIMPLIGNGQVQTNPIDEAEVARWCVEAIKAEEKIFNLGGPDVFTRRQISELCFDAIGKTPRFIRYPVGLMRALVAPVKFFDRRLYDLLAFGIFVSTVDNVAPQVGVNKLDSYLKQLTAGG